MNVRRIQPVTHPINATVRVPGSKSITNRALLLAALADGSSTLHGALFAEDTELMMTCLRQLGVGIAAEPDADRITIQGCAGRIPVNQADLFCGNSGTTLRFCTALGAASGGTFRLDGVERMRARPVDQLIDALRQLGALVEYESTEGFPPVITRSSGLRAGTVRFDRPASSQFVSAVLMIAPTVLGDVFVEVQHAISVPYLSMTVRLMDTFGVTAVEQVTGDVARFIVPGPQPYRARDFDVEPDASNASYFLAAAAVTGGRVTTTGLTADSIQGDAGFPALLARMGCSILPNDTGLTLQGPPAGRRLTGIDVDLNAMPDLAQTLAVVALFADGPTVIRNVASLRVKETDRLTALATELRKFGADVATTPDSLTIVPPVEPRPAQVATYDDHRMAMSFALAGLVIPQVDIADPACVNKTFPAFFDLWDGLGA